jgi:glycosyltransferase involved in cell wall biosynthesis
MNILFLTNHLNIGGITSYVFSLAKGLKVEGHNVYVASSDGDSLTRFTEQGIIYIPIPIRTKSEINFFKLGISFFKLLAHIKEKEVDIIHSNTRVTQVLGCLLERYTHKPHITTCHGFFKARFFRRLFPCWGSKVIAISESVREHLIRDFLVNPENIRLVYNGIDLERLKLRDSKNREEVKLRFGLGNGPVVGIVARLSDVKGHVFLIQAMKLVLAKIPDAQLLIVGEGRMEKKLARLTQELKIEKNVFFIPKVHNIQDTLYVMDLFVMPSLIEGLGLGLMEAMAWGKAVIGSEVGGLKNLIRHDYNGLLVRPADAEQLCSSIIELLEDPVKASILGNNARLFITENFSLEKMVSETEKVYAECLNAKS